MCICSLYIDGRKDLCNTKYVHWKCYHHNFTLFYIRTYEIHFVMQIFQKQACKIWCKYFKPMKKMHSSCIYLWKDLYRDSTYTDYSIRSVPLYYWPNYLVVWLRIWQSELLWFCGLESAFYKSQWMMMWWTQEVQTLEKATGLTSN